VYKTVPRTISREKQARLNQLNGTIDSSVTEGDRGLCEGLEHAFIDYQTMAEPEVFEAQVMCASCPILAACRERARITRPAWGVYGGEVWREGRIVRRQNVRQLRAYA
jgi:hypothetical protein